MSQLREQRQQAIIERDTAEDEETARQAAARVRELDQQIRSVERGEDYPRATTKSDDTSGTNFRLASIQTVMGANQMLSGAENESLGGLIAGVGQTLGGVASAFGPKGAVAGMAISAITSQLAAMASLAQNQAKKSDQMAGLAALIKNDPFYGDGTIENAREHMFSSLYDFQPTKKGVDIYDLGMSTTQFAQSATQRIRQRGMANEGLSEAFYQEALERVFSLDAGSLGQAGKYDRYGVNATDAISNLVERLSRIQNSGVTQGNYARVQEYFNLQQGIMQQLMRFQDRPNIGIANKEIEAFAQLQNYTVDSRTGSDIAAVRNTITNPQNDRMKAILYSTVEEMNPEKYAGRSDLIDRAIHDPKQQGAILRAFIQKIQNMYGGTDTPMGYWAGKALLSSIESPERRDAILRGITSGRAGQTLANGKFLEKGSDGFKELFTQEAKGYSSDVSQIATQMSDTVYMAIENLGNELSAAIDKAVQKFSSLIR